MVFHAKLFFIFATVTRVAAFNYTGSLCGCKVVRPCYMDMLEDLLERDEMSCIEEIEIGISTIMVYFTALKKYCGHMFNFTSEYYSFESRSLYEVNIHLPKGDGNANTDAHVPTILVDAGQTAGEETVILVMTVIERLMACQDNEHMVQDIRWIFLPCVNPDGMEYVRFDRPQWTKNTRRSQDGLSYGIDISRNFDSHWDECEKNTNGFSDNYPGPAAASEVETRFVRDMILKYKEDIKAYISIRHEGHGILYPHAYSDKFDDVSTRAVKLAELISLKVNQRGSSFQTFVNDSIYNLNGKPHCGNSVDYAHSQGISLSFEMRVGFGKDIDVIQNFFHRPKGFETILRSAYFSGIRELYTIISSDLNKL